MVSEPKSTLSGAARTPGASNRQLALATTSFAVCFAAELTAIDGALALLAVVLVVQIWLLTAALEAYLAGHHQAALPAAIVSGVLFAACCGLYVFVRGLDRRVRR